MRRLLALLVPALAAAPASAQSLLDVGLQGLGFHDVEVTPDGRYAVVAENSWPGGGFVYDLDAAAIVASFVSSRDVPGGLALDAVAATNERAVLASGNVFLIDLTTQPPSLLAEHDAGTYPRDVAISRGGDWAVVRGGGSTFANEGSYVYDLTTGTEELRVVGDTTPTSGPYDVDAVVASASHAVFTSREAGPSVRVTIVELAPQGGGGPTVVYDSPPAERLAGRQHDVALSPDGRHAAVRSDGEVALYLLDGPAPGLVWKRAPAILPEPYGDTAMDSLLMRNDLVLTLSRNDPLTAEATFELYDLAGVAKFAMLEGYPQDLCLTPDGTKAFAKTDTNVYQFDLANLPSGAQLSPFDNAHAPSTSNGFEAGLDSLACTDTRLVALCRQDAESRVRVFDVTSGTPVQLLNRRFPDRPTDVEITPDGTRALIAGWTRVMVLDLRTTEVALNEPIVGTNGFANWCDGVATSDDHAFFVGVANPNRDEGWWAAVDLFGDQSVFCVSGANSTGAPATMHAIGTDVVLENDIELVVQGLPPSVPGYFGAGPGGAGAAYGDGTLCIGGLTLRLPLVFADAAGTARLPLDLPSAMGAIGPGTTLVFQYAYRDAGTPAMFNVSNGLEVTFE